MAATKKKPAATKSSAKAKKVGSKGASHEFQAEVAKLLHLMVHSVYSEREVFLRELISNAADACDKLRYEALKDADLMKGDGDLKISITANKGARTLTIADNGIGMTHDEMVENLGTIARSGTQAFMEKADSGEADLQLIGQFGIGFYSAFMVAEQVTVSSAKAGSKDAWTWTSDGTGSFTVEPAKKDAAPARGTTITLQMREDAEEFLQDHSIEHIIKTYSDHIAHPIYLAGDEDVSRQLNSASALWTRAKSEITEDQYKEFFGHVSGTYSDPALTLHYKAEGLNEYTVLLFVPQNSLLICSIRNVAAVKSSMSAASSSPAMPICCRPICASSAASLILRICRSTSPGRCSRTIPPSTRSARPSPIAS